MQGRPPSLARDGGQLLRMEDDMKSLIILAAIVLGCAGCASQLPYFSDSSQPLNYEQSEMAKAEIQKRADEAKALVDKKTDTSTKPWYKLW